ncbi:MAG: hypothetical protein CSA81_13620 [Acidobacteria bacterium]|nr:MAG: hypothetical protein CSA81_13620 [Acidobacteriota bacterium]
MNTKTNRIAVVISTVVISTVVLALLWLLMPKTSTFFTLDDTIASLVHNDDIDGDGVPNEKDAFPKDPKETADMDGDSIGDNSDPDIDGDGVPNEKDAFPKDPTETADHDGDGIGDNKDEPKWFTHFKTNGYISPKTVYHSFTGLQKTLTRAEVTPYLTQYGINNQLTKNKNTCTFKDMRNVSDTLKASIKSSCQYNLLKGHNYRFIPHRTLRKYEMVIVFVRSQYGTQPENQKPRYNAYIEKAKETNIVDKNISKDELGQQLTLEALAKLIYQQSLQK